MSTRTVRYEMSEDEGRRTLLHESLRRSGGSPEGVLELIGAVLRDETWRRLPKNVDGEPFESFTEFVKAPQKYGLGMQPDDLTALLDVKTANERLGGTSDTFTEYAEIRSEVRRLLAQEREPAAEHGGDRSAGEQERATFLAHNHSSDGILARLKRDDPDLAQQVINGELTSNAAAQQKGWRKPRIVVSSPESVAKSLRQHMAPRQLEELRRLLENT